jgi:hypothetical protein
LLFLKSNVSRRAHPANPRPAFLRTKVVIKKMPEAIRQALSAGAGPPCFVFGKTPKDFQILRKNDPEGALLRFFQVCFRRFAAWECAEATR